MANTNKTRPHIRRIILACCQLAGVALLYCVFSGVIYFGAGGTIGGPGATATPGDASWKGAALIALHVACLLLVLQRQLCVSLPGSAEGW